MDGIQTIDDRVISVIGERYLKIIRVRLFYCRIIYQVRIAETLAVHGYCFVAAQSIVSRCDIFPQIRLMLFVSIIFFISVRGTPCRVFRVYGARGTPMKQYRRRRNKYTSFVPVYAIQKLRP